MTVLNNAMLDSHLGGRLAKIEDAKIRRVHMSADPYLLVETISSEPGEGVSLVPQLYKELPEYWVIDVVVSSRHEHEPSIAGNDGSNLQSRSIPLVGVTGLKGVAIVGSNKTIRLDVHKSPAVSGKDNEF